MTTINPSDEFAFGRDRLWGGPPSGSGLLSERSSPLAKLDPVLHFIRARLSQKERAELRLHILVWIDPRGFSQLENAGFAVTSFIGEIAAGYITVANLERLAALDTVKYAEGPRPMRPQVDDSVAKQGLGSEHRKTLGSGKGVIVGVIDHGIAFDDPAFLNSAGKTRILALWAQEFEELVAGEKSPELVVDDRFTWRKPYGVRYDRDDIDRQLSAAAGSPALVRHVEHVEHHGSDVAAIAAGSERDGVRGETLAGVAPHADLMIVSGRSWPAAVPLDTEDRHNWCIESPKMFDAANFLQREAVDQGKPIVINISHNDNFGPHDSKSLLERGLSDIGTQIGCVIVVSAGNNYCARMHAEGVADAQEARLVLEVRANTRQLDYIDIWYEGDAAISVAVQPPGAKDVGTDDWHSPRRGDPSPTYRRADADTLVAVYSVAKVKINGHHRIGISLVPAPGQKYVTEDDWIIRLKADKPTPFHAWVGGPSGQFAESCASRMHTVMTPGCAAGVITVGAQEMTGSGHTSLTVDSASGPSRDGRQKPELCALGERVTAPDAATSFAAPRVSGTIALMLACRPLLSMGDARCVLMNTALKPTDSGAQERWGAGMLDEAKAVSTCCSNPSSHPFTR